MNEFETGLGLGRIKINTNRIIQLHDEKESSNTLTKCSPGLQINAVYKENNEQF